MIVYVESNFVLEIALMQEEYSSCSAILDVCRTAKAKLAIPAYALIEPFETNVRRHKQRKQLLDQLSNEMKQLLRTQSYKSQETAAKDVTSLLARSADDEDQRLHKTIQSILSVAHVIPIGTDILTAGLKHQTEDEFEAHDAFIYAAVLADIAQRQPPAAIFVNKNRKDFDQPDVVSSLARNNCKILYQFQQGLDHLRSSVGA